MAIKTSFKERETWIKQFASNYDNQNWHKNKVYHPEDLDHFDFFTPYNEYTTKINPKDIIGIRYGYAYNCPSLGKRDIDWSYMLENLKRLDRVLNNFKTEKHLKEHIHKNIDSKVVLKYGKHYFTKMGQHRLCLAKYLEINEVEVKVYEHKLNKEKFVLEKTIKKMYPFLLKHKLVGNNYKQDLKRDYIDLRLKDELISIPKELICVFIKRYEDLKNNRYKRIPIIFNSFFNSSVKDRLFINLDEFKRSKNLLLALDFKIIEHIKEKDN